MNTDMTLVSIVGPTAIGKTALSLSAAQSLGCPILSADSRQFYKEMTIGTAVPSAAELQSARHYFIQHRSIQQPYSVGDFEREAITLIDELQKKHEHLVMVGGSGLYTKAVVSGLDAFPKIPETIRNELNKTLEEDGIECLRAELRTVDPNYFAQVDLNNPQRIIRGLEVYRGTGLPFSSFRTNRVKKRPFKILSIGLEAPREVLYARINARVDEMMTNGLLDEAKALFDYRSLNALQTVGYRELFQFLNHEMDLESAVALIKTNTRRFAKRQMTWFKKDPSIQWFDYRTPHAELIQTQLKQM